MHIVELGEIIRSYLNTTQLQEQSSWGKVILNYIVVCFTFCPMLVTAIVFLVKLLFQCVSNSYTHHLAQTGYLNVLSFMSTALCNHVRK